MEARLQLAPKEEDALPLGKDRIVLGSDRGSDFRLRGNGVESRHAEIVREGGRFLLRDLRSRAGTFVNGQSINERELAHGDRIRLGCQPVELVFTRSVPESAYLPLGSLRGMAALLESLRVLDSTSILEDVLFRVLDAALELTGAERAFVLLPDAEGRLGHISGRAQGGNTLKGAGLEMGRVIPDRVFQTGQAAQLADLSEPNVVDAHRRTTNLGIRAVICVPLRVVRLIGRDGSEPGLAKVIGVLYLDTTRKRAQLVSKPTLEALESLAAEASVTIDNADLYRKAVVARQAEEELQRAQEVQKALLPQKIVQTSDFQAAGVSLPCRAIGGDFLDYFEFSDGRLGIALGDVAGKGPPAAMLASYLQGLVTARVRDGDSPEEVLSDVSHMLLRHALHSRFATFFYAVVSPGALVWCNAGHPHAIVLRQDGSVEKLGRGGLPLGAMEDARYERGETHFGPGDTVVVFSDGVSEASNSSRDEFEERRLVECLCQHRGTEPAVLIDRVLQSVGAFTAGEPQSDDITLLALRRHPCPDGNAP